MAELKITLTYDMDKRSLRVDGAIMDKLAVFGILEMAKECISDFHRNLTKEAIEKANEAAKK